MLIVISGVHSARLSTCDVSCSCSCSYYASTNNGDLLFQKIEVQLTETSCDVNNCHDVCKKPHELCDSKNGKMIGVYVNA